jgi:hypothetical protein
VTALPWAVSPVRVPADGWTRRRRTAPRQSRTRVDLGGRARQSTSDAEEDDATTGPLTDARARRWVDAPPSSGSSAVPYPHRHGGSRTRSRERWLEIYSRGEWIYPRPVVAATGSSQKGESRNLLLYLKSEFIS